jgi:hypothetical protein
MNPALEMKNAASMSRIWKMAIVTQIHTTTVTMWLTMRAAASTRWRRRIAPISVRSMPP